MSGMASPVIFWVLAVVTVGAGLAVALTRNIVHSALFLVLTFIGTAGFFMLLEADFLAAVQILIYAGGVSVLLVFGVMLTRHGNIKLSNPLNRYKITGGIVAALLLLLTGGLILYSEWEVSPEALREQESTVSAIAVSMLSEYVIPFEAAALLLLVALIGAVLLAKGVKHSK